MKTIKELNEKSWYRLLKVIFIFIFIISLSSSFFIFISAIIEGKQNINTKKSFIVCDNGDKFSFEKLNIYSYEIKDNDFDDYYIENYNSICAFRSLMSNKDTEEDSLKNKELFQLVNTEEGRKVLTDKAIEQRKKISQYVNVITYLKDNNLPIDEAHINEIREKIKPDNKDYSTPFYTLDIKRGDYSSDEIWGSLIAIPIILLVFWLFKNTFYYVILGKFRPKE